MVYDAAAGLAGARLGGTSRVSFRMPQERPPTLTAEGILAMAAEGDPVTEAAPPGQEPTTVESRGGSNSDRVRRRKATHYSARCRERR